MADPLMGLTSNVNERKTALTDLAMMENLSAKIETDREKEVLAQREIANEQARFLDLSKNMLEKDRVAINKKFMMHQNALKDKIKAYGGSSTKFLQNNGMAYMKEITNSMIGSEEFVRYENNQKNLSKILEAKEKGFGHLLLPTDLQSAENYMNSKDGGQITYGGIMADVEMPPSQNFDYGTEIPMANIISYGSNAMKIKNNYRMSYPDRPEPTWEELVAFSKKMGYGGTGSNQTRMRLDAQEKAKRESYNRSIKKAKQGASGKNNKQEKQDRNFLTEYVAVQSRLPKNVSVKNLYNEEQFGTDGMMENTINKNPDMRNIVKTKNRLNSGIENLNHQGWDLESNAITELFKPNVGLSQSYEILDFNKIDVAQRVFKGMNIENGKIMGLTPDEKMFSMDGVPLIGSNKIEWDDYKGDYQIKGVFSALKANTADKEEPSLVMDVYDSEDKVDVKASVELQEGFGDSEAGYTTVIALQDDEGRLWYREVDLANQQVRQVFDVALQDDDTLTNQIKREKEAANRLEAAYKMTEDQRKIFSDAIEQYDDQVFNSSMFTEEGSQYWGAGSGSALNRYPLMKAFYMASDFIANSGEGTSLTRPSTTQSLIDNFLFSESAKLAGIEETLRDYESNLSEEEIIAQWLDGMNEGEDKNSYNYKENERTAAKWMQLAKMYRK